MKQGFFDIEKNIKERKGINVTVSSKGLVSEDGELFEFDKIFAPFMDKEITFSVRVQTVEEDIAEIE
jgi:hypothetical protein